MFVAKYHGECGFCGEEIQGKECVYALGEATILHKECLVPYATGVDPATTVIHRNEALCPDCFLIHAGEC